MKLTDPVPETIRFHISAMSYIFYERVDTFSEKYGISVPAAEIPDRVRELCPGYTNAADRSSAQLMSVRSFRPFPIFGTATDSSDLKRIRDYVALTGVHMSNILRGHPAEVLAVLFPKSTSSRFRPSDRDDFGIALLAIRVDADKLPLPTFEQFGELRR